MLNSLFKPKRLSVSLLPGDRCARSRKKTGLGLHFWGVVPSNRPYAQAPPSDALKQTGAANLK